LTKLLHSLDSHDQRNETIIYPKLSFDQFLPPSIGFSRLQSA